MTFYLLRGRARFESAWQLKWKIAISEMAVNSDLNLFGVSRKHFCTPLVVFVVLPVVIPRSRYIARCVYWNQSSNKGTFRESKGPNSTLLYNFTNITEDNHCPFLYFINHDHVFGIDTAVFLSEMIYSKGHKAKVVRKEGMDGMKKVGTGTRWQWGQRGVTRFGEPELEGEEWSWDKIGGSEIDRLKDGQGNIQSNRKKKKTICWRGKNLKILQFKMRHS